MIVGWRPTVHSPVLRRTLPALLLAAAVAACKVLAPAPELTGADADRFLAKVNSEMLQLGAWQQQTDWVAQTYITPDTEAMTARATQAYAEAVARNAKEAAKFDHISVSPEARRQLSLLKVALVVVTPSSAGDAGELTRLMAGMHGAYGRGRWCPDPARPDQCMDVGRITQEMASSRDPKRLREVWEGWRTIGPPMRKDYTRFVELANEGARELGFADTGALWRSKYDMPPDAFAKELYRLWDQVRPLYVSLHAYVRMKLHERYGDIVPPSGPIPAYLLGNIWAQDWTNVYPLVAPAGTDRRYSLTDILERRKMGPLDMVRTGERFFTSLGFAKLPATFWERSLFVKPVDRSVVCHASAWDVDLVDDLRIKMCIEQTGEDFRTIHHELGHNFYQRAYNTQPALFRDSANDGFHEAVGDTIALSVTPEYLVRIGLLDKAPGPSGDIGLLLARALDKVALLPFGLLVDQWRWQVYSGQITPEHYNEAWWALRLKYQGVAPPSPRDESYFDPAAKYHVAAVTPYARYFLADILQFQFHRALAHEAGCTGPLHRCSIYESAAAGKRLDAMLRMGLSRPWPDALETLTGSREMDAAAIRDYFAPLQQWLDAQLKDAPKGWQASGE
jgi:peptidyl-dipeptidase A